jgi:hypothetical protein
MRRRVSRREFLGMSTAAGLATLVGLLEGDAVALTDRRYGHRLTRGSGGSTPPPPAGMDAGDPLKLTATGSTMQTQINALPASGGTVTLDADRVYREYLSVPSTKTGPVTIIARW